MHILKSKYKVGTKVWGIHQARKEVREDCPTCGGEGFSSFKTGGTISCNQCYGKCTIVKSFYDKWVISYDYEHIVMPITVGMVRVEEFCDKKQVSYMCLETGVGSGRVWYEKLLWPSEEEALAECDRLNKEKEK